MSIIHIKIVSDTVCPFCYLGKLKLEAAVNQYTLRHPETKVQILWLPFNLDPTLKKAIPKRQMYIEKFGPDRSEQLQRMMTQNFANNGAKYNLDGLRGPTVDSHRLVDWVQSKPDNSVQTEKVVMALFAAYFGEARDISNVDTLIDIAAENGLDRSDVAEFLRSDAGRTKVVEESQAASIRGISGVPHFTINEKIEISGAQDPSVFYEALEKVN